MSFSPRLASFGPFEVSKGVNLKDGSSQIGDSESPESVNFLHIGSVLLHRKVLQEYGSFAGSISSRSNRWNGLRSVKFENGDQFLAALDKDSFYTHDGANWTDRTNSVITSGSDTSPWDICYGIDGGFGGTGTLFAGNGENGLIYWNPDNNANAYLLTNPNSSYTYSGGPSAMAPRYCTVFGGMLILANIKEGAHVHTTRMRSSAINDFLEFNTANGASVTDHASNTSGEIVGLSSLHKQLLIFKEDSVIIGQETGNASATLAFPLELRGGCLSGRSFQAITPSKGIFLGQDNVYLIEGGQITGIGDKIVKDLFSKLAYDKSRMILSSISNLEGVYRLFIPTDSSFATRCYAFNWKEGLWWVEEYPGEIHSSSSVDFGGGTLIKDLTSLIKNYDKTLISSWGTQSRSTSIVYGSSYNSTDFRIFKANNGVKDYAAIPNEVNPKWSSKDFILNQDGYSELRLIGLQYSSTSNVNITVSVSTDRGKTFGHSETKVASAGENKLIVFKFRATGLYHRIRVSVTSVSGSSANPILVQTIRGKFIPRRDLR